MRAALLVLLLGCSSEPTTGSMDAGTNPQNDSGMMMMNNDTGAPCATQKCNGVCVDTKTDPQNCGTCGNTCTVPTGGMATCTNGMCGKDCGMGKTLCGNACIDLQTDNNHCGMCNAPCVSMTAQCTSGMCCAMGQKVCSMKCTDTQSDSANCGMCGNKCPSNMPNCMNGQCAPLYTFTGPKTNFSDSLLGGWNLCYSDLYSASGSSVMSKVLVQCNQAKLMLACRKTNDTTIIVAAMGPRADVIFNTGSGNTGHVANGVKWYYDSFSSWGFASANDALDRLDGDGNPQCDTSAQNPGSRLCWHVGSGQLTAGWRCGSTQNLNASGLYERVVYQAP